MIGVNLQHRSKTSGAHSTVRKSITYTGLRHTHCRKLSIRDQISRLAELPVPLVKGKVHIGCRTVLIRAGVMKVCIICIHSIFLRVP